MNKKGQIATALLVIAALALSGTALFTMVSFNGDLQFKSVELAELSEKLELTQNYLIIQARNFGKELLIDCFDCSKEQLGSKGADFDAKNNPGIEGTGNFFGKLRNNEFTFEKKQGTYILQIKNLFVQSEQGANKIVRDFNICIELNETGDYFKDCELQNI